MPEIPRSPGMRLYTWTLMDSLTEPEQELAITATLRGVEKGPELRPVDPKGENVHDLESLDLLLGWHVAIVLGWEEGAPVPNRDQLTRLLASYAAASVRRLANANLTEPDSNKEDTMEKEQKPRKTIEIPVNDRSSGESKTIEIPVVDKSGLQEGDEGT